MHVAAALAVLLLAVPWWGKAITLGAIAASAWHAFGRLVGMRRICSVTLHADGHAQLTRRDGSSNEALVDLESTVGPLMTVLLLRVQGRREALIFVAGALAKDDFRRLRLWLRWRIPTR